MPPMNAARRRAMRAVLSALAGGGLTAAGLGGPVPSALAAQVASTSAGSEGSTTTASPSSGGGEAETSTQTTTSTTTTTEAAASAPSTTTAPAGTVSTPAPAPPAPAAKEAPKVVLQKRQKSTKGAGPGGSGAREGSSTATKKAAGANNVALSPQLVAAQASALASSEASIQALGFYRIPLFLLPIYKAAAVQYGVPWQILAAINEIETNYGTDQSVSTAGAVGWMQFMPETWLQYGVDALNSGYADPYNPVDAIFAAARYLRAAGASTDLHAAILAYNHSEEYVSSVLLRAKLISAYPRAVIATLTGLIDGRLPVTGKHVAWSAPTTLLPSASTATANAGPVAGTAPAGQAPPPGSTSPRPATPGSAAAPSPATPGSTAAPSPATVARAAAAAQPLELSELTSAPDAEVVAVQNGRILGLGHSNKLGRYVVLRDVYGDVFTYAGLGSIAPSYLRPGGSNKHPASPLIEVASRRDPAPSQAASAGFQSSAHAAGEGQEGQDAGARGRPGLGSGRSRSDGLGREQGPPLRASGQPGRPCGGGRREGRQGARRARKQPRRPAQGGRGLQRHRARHGGRARRAPRSATSVSP